MKVFLHGKRGLVVGIANPCSIAWGCAKALHEFGAELMITWRSNEAKPHTESQAEQVQASPPWPWTSANLGSWRPRLNVSPAGVGCYPLSTRPMSSEPYAPGWFATPNMSGPVPSILSIAVSRS
ncbi:MULTISPECIES: SDR family oxidoreductase [Pseudomonas]|uniref:SDR family oxidoreductase n=1 Tax=Pseudomonas TaxID=286 RepID=UPI002FD91393